MNNIGAASLIGPMAALTDPVRCRLLSLMERHELTVSDLCAVLQLPQSTVSRHLKVLVDEGLLQSRREGTSRFYTLSPGDLDPAVRRLWLLVRPEITAMPAVEHDERRLKGVLARRSSKSREFFSSAAGQWDRLRGELFGSSFHLHALLGLADEEWVVGDLGCGTGQMAEAMAPFVRRVVAVDGSGDMLQAARRRLRPHANVEVRRGEIEALPLDDGELDAAVVVLVLHHVPDPARALRETARVLRPGGRLVLVDMLPHDHDEYRQQMGHVWLGFGEDQVRRTLEAAGFSGGRVRTLPPDPQAKGPTLFVATAGRSPVRGGMQVEAAAVALGQ